MIIKPLPPPDTVYWRALPLIFAGWLLIAIPVAMTMNGPGPPQVVLGLIIGTMFQQTLIAAGWAALGPGKLLWRLALSLAWACSMGAALAIPVFSLEGDASTVMFVVTMAGFWLVGQLPIWLAAMSFGLRLRYQGLDASTQALAVNDHKERQFGIGQLMAFTGLVAVILGIGRLIVASGLVPQTNRQMLSVLALMLCTQISIALPLLLAMFLRKRAIQASLLGVLFVVIVTIIELPVARQIFGVPSRMMAELAILIWINVFSLLWVIAFAVTVRNSGYQFGVPQPDEGIQYLDPVKPLPTLPRKEPGEIVHITE